MVHLPLLVLSLITKGNDFHETLQKEEALEGIISWNLFSKRKSVDFLRMKHGV